MLIDFYSFYFNSVRSIINCKAGRLINNVYKVPYISQLFFHFNLDRIEDVDDVQIYNYLYLFKFFFGSSAFLSRVRSTFDLGTWTYSFRVCLNVRDARDVYMHLVYFHNDFLSLVDKVHYKYLISGRKSNNFSLVLLDPIFSVRKRLIWGYFFLTSISLSCVYAKLF